MNPLKPVILLVLSLIPLIATGQILSDGFEDRDFTDWFGHLTHFRTTEVENNILLQLNADSAGSSFMSRAIQFEYGYWEFYLQLDFSPSRNNSAIVYLISDTLNLNAPVNGYALHFGENGQEDRIRLFRYADGEPVREVLHSSLKINNGGAYRVRVSISQNKVWELFAAEGYDGMLIKEAEAADSLFTSPANPECYSGFKLHYTKSNLDAFKLDFRVDVPALKAEQLIPQAPGVLHLKFNREVSFGTLTPANFSLNNPASQPAAIDSLSPDSLALSFDPDLPGSGKHRLFLSGIKDRAGENPLRDTVLSFFIFDLPAAGDIVINEFLPVPPDELPEYVELFNNSTKYLNLQHWIFSDSRSEVVFSEKELTFLPFTYKVFTRDSAALAFRFGPDSVFYTLNLPTLNNGGDLLQISNSQGMIMDSLTYSDEWVSDGTSLERRSATVPSLYRENWLAADSALTGSPGKGNYAGPDLNPPVVTDLYIHSPNEFRLRFSRNPAPEFLSPEFFRITRDDGTLLANYSVYPVADYLAGLLHPAGFDSSKTGSGYLIELKGIQNIFGAEAADTVLSVTRYSTKKALPGDVFINEIFSAANDTVPEFIELLNVTGENLNLKNWTLEDGGGKPVQLSRERQIASFEQPFITLGRDSSGPGSHYFPVSSFPSLNNNSDRLILRNETGTVLDSLTYYAEWAEPGFSLERRSTTLPGHFGENWGRPENQLHSAGQHNLVPDDIISPKVTGITLPDNHSAKIHFSERIQSAGSVSLIWSPRPPDYQSTITDSTLHLQFTSPLADTRTYHLTLSKHTAISDLFGNAVKDTTIRIRHLSITEDSVRSVVFNEFQTSSQGGFIELLNYGEHHTDLSGWSLDLSAGAGYVFPHGQYIAAGEYLILHKDYLPPPGTESLPLPSAFRLPDRTVQLSLVNAEGLVVDSVSFSSEFNPSEHSVSLEKTDPATSGPDHSKWSWSAAEAGHTAGHLNSVFEEDSQPPVPLFVSFEGNHLRVDLDEFTDPGGASFAMNGEPLPILQSTGNRLYLQVRKEPGAEATLSIHSLSDVKGNSADYPNLPVMHPPGKSELLFTEILFDPVADDNDHLPDQREYVEVYNPGPGFLSLEALLLRGPPDEDGKVKFIIPAETSHRRVAPGAYALIYAEPESMPFAETDLKEYFSLQPEDSLYSLPVRSSSLSLNNDSGILILADSSGLVIDSLHYRAGWHNPNLYHHKGLSLERIDLNAPAHQEGNWSSSVHPTGGTPLMQNSIHQPAANLNRESLLQAEPVPFSPDNDGFEDRLYLHYRFNEPDYLLRIRIFDRYGRLVRKLTENYRAGFEGTLTWDGFNDQGHSNRSGIYVILMEAGNTETGKRITRKKLAVIAGKR